MRQSSAVVQTRKWQQLPVRSVLPPTTDICRSSEHVRLVPNSDTTLTTMSVPDHITELVCEDCGNHVHVFGHYYGLPVNSTRPLIREQPTSPSTSSRGICEATLSRVVKRKKAAPHDAVIPARTHGRRRWTTRPDAIAPSGSLSRRNCSSDHTRNRVDFGNTGRGRRCSHRPTLRMGNRRSRPPWRPEHSHRSKDHLRSNLCLFGRGCLPIPS
jgi:hypothetical protein